MTNDAIESTLDLTAVLTDIEIETLTRIADKHDKLAYLLKIEIDGMLAFQSPTEEDKNELLSVRRQYVKYGDVVGGLRTAIQLSAA